MLFPNVAEFEGSKAKVFLDARYIIIDALSSVRDVGHWMKSISQRQTATPHTSFHLNCLMLIFSASKEVLAFEISTVTGRLLLAGLNPSSRRVSWLFLEALLATQFPLVSVLPCRIFSVPSMWRLRSVSCLFEFFPTWAETTDPCEDTSGACWPLVFWASFPCLVRPLPPRGLEPVLMMLLGSGETEAAGEDAGSCPSASTPSPLPPASSPSVFICSSWTFTWI